MRHKPSTSDCPGYGKEGVYGPLKRCLFCDCTEEEHNDTSAASSLGGVPPKPVAAGQNSGSQPKRKKKNKSRNTDKDSKIDVRRHSSDLSSTGLESFDYGKYGTLDDGLESNGYIDYDTIKMKNIPANKIGKTKSNFLDTSMDPLSAVDDLGNKRKTAVFGTPTDSLQLNAETSHVFQMPKPPPQEFKGQNEGHDVQVFHHHHHEVVEPPPRRRSSILAKKNNKALYRRRMHAPAGVLEDGKGNAYYSKRTLNFNTSIARYKPGEAPAVTRKLNHIFGTIDPQRASPISERNMISSFSIVGGFDECEHLSEDENDYTHSIYDNDPFNRRRTSSLSLDNFDLVLQSLATLKEKEANWKPPPEDNLFSREDSRSDFQLYNETPQVIHKKPKEIFLDSLKKVNGNVESKIYDYSKDEEINNETFTTKEEKKGDKSKKKKSKSPEAIEESDTEIGGNDMQRSVDSELEDEEVKDFEPKKKKKKKTKKKKKEGKKEKSELEEEEEEEEEEREEEEEEKEIEIKKKDKKKKKKKKKEKVKDVEESEDELNEDEEEEESESISSKKKDKKKKDKKKKDKKKKDKKKKDKKEKERFSDDEEDEDGDAEKDSKALESNGNDNTAKVDRQSLQRRKEKIEALKQKADEEDAEAEAMENEAEAEGDGEGGDEGGAPEDEFAEEQFGIQYDPDRQICLGDKLKIGQKVFAVDMASGKKFRRGKIVGFEEPATYTVKFGMFRKQQTQRLDIQVRRPKMAKKGGLMGALKSPPSIHAAAAAGDIQGVLDNLVKNADSIDKVGGKLNQKPLYYACQNGHEEVAKLLLRWGGEDDPDGRILKVATPELRSTLLSFGWGKMGGFPDED